MKALLVTLFALLSLVIADPVTAQTDALAAERAKLGNQRIQTEAERQARAEEERRQKAAAHADAQAQAQAKDADLTRALEQLRTLGELKDAGYLTDDEFQRIKARILDSNL